MLSAGKRAMFRLLSTSHGRTELLVPEVVFVE